LYKDATDRVERNFFNTMSDDGHLGRASKVNKHAYHNNDMFPNF